MSELVVRGLEKSFGPTAVLHGLDLTVPQGALCAVLGPSGCGKTTLLRIIAGFDAPDRGTVALGGRVVTVPGAVVPPERRRVGVVPQEGALFPHLSVADNVGFGLSRAGRLAGRWGAGPLGRRAGRTRAPSPGWGPTAARGRRVAELLELVGLAGYGGRMPAELSGGQQQRVALARALAPDPALVLLDEPFTALDTGLRAALREDVRAALRATGATAVLVTHDQQEALSIADSVAVLRSGVVVQAAAPGDLYTAPGDVGVATFVGEAVVLPAVVSGGLARTALGSLAVRPGPAGSVGQVVIRPEQVLLGSPQHGIPARVRGTTFYGHDALIQLELLAPGEGGSAAAAGPVGPGPAVSARSLGHDVVAENSVVGLRVAGEVSFFPAAAQAPAPARRLVAQPSGRVPT